MHYVINDVKEFVNDIMNCRNSGTSRP